MYNISHAFKLSNTQLRSQSVICHIFVGNTIMHTLFSGPSSIARCIFFPSFFPKSAGELQIPPSTQTQYITLIDLKFYVSSIISKMAWPRVKSLSFQIISIFPPMVLCSKNVNFWDLFSILSKSYFQELVRHCWANPPESLSEPSTDFANLKLQKKL